jgi:hypothetical protein
LKNLLILLFLFTGVAHAQPSNLITSGSFSFAIPLNSFGKTETFFFQNGKLIEQEKVDSCYNYCELNRFSDYDFHTWSLSRMWVDLDKRIYYNGDYYYGATSLEARVSSYRKLTIDCYNKKRQVLNMDEIQNILGSFVTFNLNFAESDGLPFVNLTETLRNKGSITLIAEHDFTIGNDLQKEEYIQDGKIVTKCTKPCLKFYPNIGEPKQYKKGDIIQLNWDSGINPRVWNYIEDGQNYKATSSMFHFYSKGKEDFYAFLLNPFQNREVTYGEFKKTVETFFEVRE